MRRTAFLLGAAMFAITACTTKSSDADTTAAAAAHAQEETAPLLASAGDARPDTDPHFSVPIAPLPSPGEHGGKHLMCARVALDHEISPAAEAVPP